MQNTQLLDSFDRQTSDDEINELDTYDEEYKGDKYKSDTSLDTYVQDRGEDTRLSNQNLIRSAPESSSEGARIHTPEGSSSESPFRASSSAGIEGTPREVDLESQTSAGPPPGVLTTRERILNVLNHLVPIKQTYERLNNGLTTGRMQTNTPGRFIGQGTDGVFRNLMAKPDTESNRHEQEVHPPSYEEAAADATPEYWESTVISPMYEDEVFVEGLPVGNVASFVWNGLVTVAFQFVGFVLCYLLHTSHAAKQGSRAGLGITLSITGFGMIPSNFGHADKVPERYQPDDPNAFDITKSQSIKTDHLDTYNSGLFKQHSSEDSSVLAGNTTPYFAYGLIAFGLFVIIKSIVDFSRVKQMERAILAPRARSTETATVTESTTSEGSITPPI